MQDILGKNCCELRLAGSGKMTEIALDQKTPAMMQLNEDLGNAVIKARQSILKEIKREVSQL